LAKKKSQEGKETEKRIEEMAKKNKGGRETKEETRKR
jgi:hypothetical protein